VSWRSESPFTVGFRAYVGFWFHCSPNPVITRSNQAFERMFGYEQGELVGQKSCQIFENELEYQRFSAQVKPFLRRGAPIKVRGRFMRCDGRLITCQVSATAVNPSTGTEGTVWLFEDVTEADKTEAEIRKATIEFEAVMNNSPVGIIFTANRQITRFNPKFCEMFGYTETEARHLTGRMLFPSDALYDHLGETAYPLLSQGKPYHDELELVRKDGSMFWAQVTAYVVDECDTSRGTIWTISDCSEGKASREELRSTLVDLQTILESAPVGIVFTKGRVVLKCNPQAEALFGVPAGTLTGKSTRHWYPSEKDFEDLGNDLYPKLLSGEIQARERMMVRDNGDTFWCRLTGRIRDLNNPTGGGAIWVLEDLSYRRRAELALANANALIQTVLNEANVSILSTGPDGVIRLMNKTAERWLGYAASEVIGKGTPEWFHDPEEMEQRGAELATILKRPLINKLEVISNQAKGYGGHDRDWIYVRKDGSRLPIHLTVTAQFDGNGTITGYTLVGVDLTARQQAEELARQTQKNLELQVNLRTSELAEAHSRLMSQMEEQLQIENRMRQLAHFDPLTGLPNRNLLIERLDQTLAHARRHKQHVGILFIDLDHFKNINDTLGHQVGDLLLGQVAKRMSYSLRDSDTIGRLGGDEFLLMVPKVTSNAKLVVIAEKLIEVLTQPIDIESHQLHITPSIGICCFPEHGEDAETLMRNADTAMYHAKSCGRNNYKFFVDKLNAEVDKRFQIETALRYAESQHELEIVFQPIVSSESMKVVSVEALLRWHSSALGDVPPAEFIPIAEESGTIVPIGEWVLRESCHQIMKLRSSGHPGLGLAVNLSPRQFRQPDLVKVVAEILEESRLPPASLKLEITESSLMNNVSDVISTLQQLVALGVHLSIDDFGTGYSSLAYLKDFPVHTLKIDRSFVRDLGHDTRCEGIVRTIVALAKTLGLSALAEGVETPYQRDQLAEMGCEFFQGFFFHRPMSLAQLSTVLAGERPKGSGSTRRARLEQSAM